jgi:hypothetical protein
MTWLLGGDVFENRVLVSNTVRGQITDLGKGIFLEPEYDRLRMSSDERLRMTGQEGWSFLAGSANTLEMTSWMGYCCQLG